MNLSLKTAQSYDKKTQKQENFNKIFKKFAN